MVIGVGPISMPNVIEKWMRSALDLITDTVKKSYDDALDKLYNSVPNAKNLFESHNDYMGRRINDGHFIDLILCFFPYRDLQYGFGGRGQGEKTKELKLNWIAFHILALENLLKNKNQLRHELQKVAEEKGEEHFGKEQIDFIINYINATIAELSALYVYMMLDKTILPFGFMQHAITSSGGKGPTLGDFIEVDTLTFVDVKTHPIDVNNAKVRVKIRRGLIRLMASTRLPSAYIVPHYAVSQGNMDNTKIVLDRYTLGAFGNINEFLNYYEAPIMKDHIKILGNISLLERNAKLILQRKKKK